ncbi:hypothetical protein ACIRF8_20315 [Streptomyces sp. NPDC102406]|uniref:hypothetical protein n=1 Tax=Streptomyces sp. NPDC102406 TaxID=3366171 RepID=UPI003802FEF9
MRTPRALAVSAVVVAALGAAGPAASAWPETSAVTAAPGALPHDEERPAPQKGAEVGGVRGTGATPADMAIGGVLVASSLVGGGVFWMRRRAEGRA